MEYRILSLSRRNSRRSIIPKHSFTVLISHYSVKVIATAAAGYANINFAAPIPVVPPAVAVSTTPTRTPCPATGYSALDTQHCCSPSFVQKLYPSLPLQVCNPHLQQYRGLPVFFAGGLAMPPVAASLTSVLLPPTSISASNGCGSLFKVGNCVYCAGLYDTTFETAPCETVMGLLLYST